MVSGSRGGGSKEGGARRAGAAVEAASCEGDVYELRVHGFSVAGWPRVCRALRVVYRVFLGGARRGRLSLRRCCLEQDIALRPWPGIGEVCVYELRVLGLVWFGPLIVRALSVICLIRVVVERDGCGDGRSQVGLRCGDSGPGFDARARELSGQ